MARGSYFTRLLATAFLSGSWTPDELKRRGKLVFDLPPRRRWLALLAAALVTRYPNPPGREQLVDILEDLWAERDLWEYADEIQNPSLLRLPRPEMRPVAGLSGRIEVPPIVTSGDLSDWLGVTSSELDWFTDRSRPINRVPAGPLRHYRYRLLAKSCGRWRLLEIPKPRLMQLQRNILNGILNYLPAHSAAHAYRPGRSIASYVKPHAHQQVVLHVDLRDFFPSVRASRVHALFRTVGYPDSVARQLTSLCTHSTADEAFDRVTEFAISAHDCKVYQQRHLPQGAPTSPALANLCAWRLDVRLSALARNFGATYTRYADDLLFSGGNELQRGMTRFRILVLEIAIGEGFFIRNRKTRVMPQSQSQRVAGIILNEHPNPPRHDFDQLKALLFNCVRHGPESQNREQRVNFAQHLLGRIAYLSMINPQRGRKLKTLFDQIEWSPRS